MARQYPFSSFANILIVLVFALTTGFATCAPLIVSAACPSFLKIQFDQETEVGAFTNDGKSSPTEATSKQRNPVGKTDKQATIVSQVGPLQEVGEVLSEIIGLTWARGHLECQLPDSYYEAEEELDELRDRFGYADGSEYGRTSFTLAFGGEQVLGFVSLKNLPDNSVRKSVFVRELTKPFRSLELVMWQPEHFTVTLSAPAEDYILRFGQTAKADFFAQEIYGTEVATFKAPDFSGFSQQYVGFAERAIHPTLKLLGIGDLLYPYHKDVRAEALNQLSRIDAEDFRDLSDYFDRLNDEQFEVRELASQQLAENCEHLKPLLVRVVFDQQFPVEIVSRVRKVLYETISEREQAIIELIRDSAILNSPPYLAWLLQTDLSQTHAAAVIEQLHRLTQLSPIPDSQEWNDWVSGLVAAHTSDQTDGIEDMPGDEIDLQVLQVAGELSSLREHLGSLMNFTIADGNLLINRTLWSDYFQNKSVKDIIEELQSELEARRIPKSWLNAGGQMSVRETSHVTMIFENIREAIKAESDDWFDRFDPFKSQDRTMGLATKTFAARLNLPLGQTRRPIGGSKTSTTQTNAHPTPKAIDPIHLFIGEKKGRNREIAVTEMADQLIIAFVCEPNDVRITLIQRPGHVVLHEIRGLRAKALQANDFVELYNANREYFDHEWFPLIQHMGIHFSTDIVPEVALDKLHDNEDENDDQPHVENTDDH
ncbi:MAG TPA: hypothetical protein PKD64_11345 [Pirellulaceae bacterium]|nr:hypothetical protein [Pirellulaceae bacterium]HMO92777.1 hypothetical protein [Pirellulaceae bacterium]HMP69359.1 hypothetical protein [Pirellulaceae bacterium]